MLLYPVMPFYLLRLPVLRVISTSFVSRSEWPTSSLDILFTFYSNSCGPIEREDCHRVLSLRGRFITFNKFRTKSSNSKLKESHTIHDINLSSLVYSRIRIREHLFNIINFNIVVLC